MAPPTVPVPWRRTWNDSQEDWCCGIGRVLLMIGGTHADRWLWSMYAFGPGIERDGIECQGYADTRDLAMAEVRRAWDLATLNT